MQTCIPHRGTEELVCGTGINLYVLADQNPTVGLVIAYTSAMFILYTVAPILYRMASSGYYNLSLLSSDFYGLLFGLFLYVRFVFLEFDNIDPSSIK